MAARIKTGTLEYLQQIITKTLETWGTTTLWTEY